MSVEVTAGQRWKVNSTGEEMEVIAVHGTEAWVHYAHGGYGRPSVPRMYELYTFIEPWSPAPGDVIWVRDYGGDEWMPRVFVERDCDGEYSCIVGTIASYDSQGHPITCGWKEAKPAEPSSVIAVPVPPNYKLFEINWSDAPYPFLGCEEGCVIGDKVDGYRICAFTDDPEWELGDPYEMFSCDPHGNRKYAIGKKEN